MDLDKILLEVFFKDVIDDQGFEEVPRPAGGCEWHTPQVSGKAFFVLLTEGDTQEKVRQCWGWGNLELIW